MIQAWRRWASTIPERLNVSDQSTTGTRTKPTDDLVADHLRGRAKRRIEGIFGVGRPAGDDHAVDAQRGDGEQVEQADIDVGEHHSRPERNHRPADQGHREGEDRGDDEQAAIGARRDDRLLEEDLEAVGEALQQAERPDHVGPAAKRHRRPDLAVGIDDHRHRQHQRQSDDQDEDEGGEEPAGAVAQPGALHPGGQSPPAWPFRLTIIPRPPGSLPWRISAEQRWSVGEDRAIGLVR